MFTKPALCTYRKHIPEVATGLQTIHQIPKDFWDIPTFLSDRVGAYSCEENPEYQQLLPYVALINEKNEVFMYTRGGGGGESKLFARTSIGLGGHIDDYPQSGRLRAHVFNEARRELEEEVGFEGDLEIEPQRLLIDHLYDVEPDAVNKVYVGQVHLGILCIAHCKTTQVTKMEEGVIENAKWMSIANFDADAKSRLEPWSAMALDFIKGRR